MEVTQCINWPLPSLILIHFQRAEASKSLNKQLLSPGSLSLMLIVATATIQQARVTTTSR